MILKGKCSSDFDTYLYKNYPSNIISENCGYSYGMFERDLQQISWIVPECMLNALIIEFFDSVGIWEITFEREYSKNIDSFKNICIEAIKKANEIYNRK